MEGKKTTREDWEKAFENFPAEYADLLFSAAAKMRQEMYGGGPPRVLKPCPKCGEKLSARDLRVHKPRCGSHIVPCRYGCGYTGNPLGASQHEAVCAKNPANK